MSAVLCGFVLFQICAPSSTVPTTHTLTHTHKCSIKYRAETPVCFRQLMTLQQLAVEMHVTRQNFANFI